MTSAYCGKCFERGATAVAKSIAEGERAVCELCSKAGETWPIAVWAEALADVVAMYEPQDGGTELGVELRDQWSIFSSRATGDIDRFIDDLCQACSSTLRHTDGVALVEAARAQDAWLHFRETISRQRRWHSPVFVDAQRRLQLMVETRRDHLWPQTRDVFRARMCSDSRSRLNYRDLGAPPAGRATAGRANSSGIPVLYAATSELVAIYESRPVRGATVAVAHLRPRSGRLRLLDMTSLADVALNPFEAEASANTLIELRVATDLGRIIGAEFSRPVRLGDDIHDYVPTQYVAEYIAEQGYDGVLYDSSFGAIGGPDGANLAIFDLRVLTVVQKAPKHFAVTGVAWETAPV